MNPRIEYKDELSPEQKAQIKEYQREHEGIIYLTADETRIRKVENYTLRQNDMYKFEQAVVLENLNNPQKRDHQGMTYFASQIQERANNLHIYDQRRQALENSINQNKEDKIPSSTTSVSSHLKDSKLFEPPPPVIASRHKNQPNQQKVPPMNASRNQNTSTTLTTQDNKKESILHMRPIKKDVSNQNNMNFVAKDIYAKKICQNVKEFTTFFQTLLKRFETLNPQSPILNVQNRDKILNLLQEYKYQKQAFDRYASQHLEEKSKLSAIEKNINQIEESVVPKLMAVHYSVRQPSTNKMGNLGNSSNSNTDQQPSSNTQKLRGR